MVFSISLFYPHIRVSNHLGPFETPNISRKRAGKSKTAQKRSVDLQTWPRESGVEAKTLKARESMNRKRVMYEKLREQRLAKQL